MENEEKSFGELPTLGRTEEEQSAGTPRSGPSWSTLGLSEAGTLKPTEGIRDDGRTDRARRWKAGETILGRYVVERELGEGGMGVVYECLDTVGGVKVAVKSLPPEVGRDRDEMEEVRENFRLVYRLSHPNIAGVRVLEKDGRGEYHLVMELAEGESLRRWSRQKRKGAGVPLEEAIPVLRQVASALDYAHSEKVVHRDVKPGNIMVDAKGRVKVLDFGLAAQIRTSMSRVSRDAGRTSGTRPYMAPEQWEGQPQDARTDQYALGVTAYELLAGRLPFECDDTEVLRTAVLHGRVRDIEGVGSVPMAALRRALAKEPKERFATCEAFVDTLETAGRHGGASRPGEPVKGSAAGTAVWKTAPTTARPEGSPHRMFGGWLVSLAMAAVVAVGVWAWKSNGEKSRPEGSSQQTRSLAFEPAQQTVQEHHMEGAEASKVALECLAAEQQGKTDKTEGVSRPNEENRIAALEMAHLDAERKNAVTQQQLEDAERRAREAEAARKAEAAAREKAEREMARLTDEAKQRAEQEKRLAAEHDAREEAERATRLESRLGNSERGKAEMPRKNTSPASAPSPVASASTVRSAQAIRVGDRLTITLRGIPQPESIECQVDEYGMVSLPAISEVRAEGLSAAELQKVIRQTYLDRGIYKKINVTVITENGFAQPETVTASHILIAFNDGDDETAKAAKRKRLVGIRQQILNGADFAQMAVANSDCPSRVNGGDLGSFGRGMMVPAFENAAFSQKPGQVGDIVETSFGYHLIKVTDHQNARTPTFE